MTSRTEIFEIERRWSEGKGLRLERASQTKCSYGESLQGRNHLAEENSTIRHVLIHGGDVSRRDEREDVFRGKHDGILLEFPNKAYPIPHSCVDSWHSAAKFRAGRADEKKAPQISWICPKSFAPAGADDEPKGRKKLPRFPRKSIDPPVFSFFFFFLFSFDFENSFSRGIVVQKHNLLIHQGRRVLLALCWLSSTFF